MVTMEAQRIREPTETLLGYLETLGEQLARRGLHARLEAPAGRVPSLRVTNPRTAALEENVYAGCGADGTWWFWWSWAERISVADDLDTATTAITRVLADRVTESW